MDDTNTSTAFELARMDAEDRELDDLSDGIDWDEIIATTQPDCEAGRFAFNSEDYATEEEAMAAMEKFVEDAIKDGLREATARHSLDVTRA